MFGSPISFATRSGGWKAWVNTMPPPPDDIHVVGELLVPNPGVDAVLSKAVPQGFNPDILVLNLTFFQKPGFWPQMVSWAQARYDAVLLGDAPTEVQVLLYGSLLDSMEVETVS